ncbi:unnamed protein product [Prorocentrum cordatum]|uniref:Uncharacterized protein n=1 Tax=Prorocentrum cordatum TaxID=2364126 RepID=A0ABN9SI53_9DINO|nr:unnamed protein product [Polarella glacialis]
MSLEGSPRSGSQAAGAAGHAKPNPKQSWAKLLDRVADSEKGTTASIRVTKVDNDRTKLLKEVLNCAAKATMGTRRPPEVTSGTSMFEGCDTIEEVHKVKERYESISGVPSRSSSKAVAEPERAGLGASCTLDAESVLSVAAGIDPALRGVLANAGQRLAGLHLCLQSESEPPACPGPVQAPSLRRDVVLVSRGGPARQGELQRLEEAADQFIDQFIQFGPLDALDATFADPCVDDAALAEAFPGRSDHNPALVGLTDYLLERPEEWRRTMQRIQSNASFTVKQRAARQVCLETCPSALSLHSASSEAPSGPESALSGGGGGSRQQHRALRTATTPFGSTPPAQPRARGRGSLGVLNPFGDPQG